jgi:hypothetical protein
VKSLGQSKKSSNGKPDVLWSSPAENTTKKEVRTPIGCTKAQFRHLPAHAESKQEKFKLGTASQSDSRHRHFYTRLF